MTTKPIIVPAAILSVLDPDRDRPLAGHLSYTQLAMYMRCSMQYYFRYVLHLKERPKVSLSIGKGGHGALEFNTKRKLRTGEDAPTEEVIQKASDLIDHYLTDLPASEYEKDVEAGALKDKQLAATKVFRVRDAPGITPIGSEVEYTLDVNPYVPANIRDLMTSPVRPVVTKIDVLYKDKDTIVQDHDQGMAVAIEDYKYVTRKTNQGAVNLSPQLTTYTTGFHALTGKWPSKVGIRMMHPGSMSKKPKNDDPIPDSIQLLREPEHMTPKALERRMVRIAFQFAQAERGIREGIYSPVDDPMTCSWCGFRDRCQGTSVTDFEAAKIRETTTPPL